MNRFPDGFRRRVAWRIALPAIGVIARVLWRLRIDRDQSFPPPPFVIAANHHSFLDPPMLGAAYGRPVKFMALSDLFGRYRLLDYTFDTFGPIPVGRQLVALGALREALSHLSEGGVVAVFPEGTRNRLWGEVTPRSGAAWLASRSKVPLVPVAITGTDTVLGIDNKLRRGIIRVRIGPSLYPTGVSREAVADLTKRWQTWMNSALGSSRSPVNHRSPATQ